MYHKSPSIPRALFALTSREHVFRLFLPGFRRASHCHTAPTFRETKANIPVGNSGTVVLNILKPVFRKSTKKAPAARNVIIYLPPGPLFAPSTAPTEATGAVDSTRRKKRKQQLTPQRVLASTTLSTIVTVNYRLDRSHSVGHKYPTPVHDTLAGFDWVTQHLEPQRLCVFGTHIGGSLAVMLALTEPRSLWAVAAKEPVCDWVGLDDYCQVVSEVDSTNGHNGPSVQHGNVDKPDSVPTEAETNANDETTTTAGASQQHRKRGRKRKPAPPDLVPLLESRSLLFRKPENYFDSFASPALFLRSPGKICPKTFPQYVTGPEYPVPILQKPETTEEEDDDWYSQTLADEALDVDMVPEQVDEERSRASTLSSRRVRRRKVLARWPPHGLDYGLDAYSANPFSESPVSEKLVLPPVRIFVHGNPMHEDAPPTEAETEEDTLAATVERIKLDDHQHEPSLPTAESDGKYAISKSRRGSIADVAKSTTGETVLARQGAEMVSLMHNACFWDHPVGFAEQRVRLVQVPFPTVEDKGAQKTTEPEPADNKEDVYSIEKQAGEWFAEVLRPEELRGQGETN
ncbi:hypothetical protein VTO42DRAFT_285 [Malbranchea cinnamomea]